jgi:hypothetical protein
MDEEQNLSHARQLLGNDVVLCSGLLPFVEKLTNIVVYLSMGSSILYRPGVVDSH